MFSPRQTVLYSLLVGGTTTRTFCIMVVTPLLSLWMTGGLFLQAMNRKYTGMAVAMIASPIAEGGECYFHLNILRLCADLSPPE